MWNLVGTHYRFPPEPPIPEHTQYVDAGCIKIGVESRHLTAVRVQELHDGTPFEELYKEHRKQSREKQSLSDQKPPVAGSLTGVSLHVVDAESGHEYLRFDCFEDEPHYHYLHPWTTPETCDNHCVEWDPVAHGPMTPWALESLRGRLPEMLTEAGGAHLAARLEQDRLDRAVGEVEQLVMESVTAS